MTKPRILPQPANPELGGNDLSYIGDNTNLSWTQDKNTGEVEWSTSPVSGSDYII